MPRGQMLHSTRSDRKKKPKVGRPKKGTLMASFEKPMMDPVTGQRLRPLLDVLEDALLWGAKTHDLQAIAFNPPYSVSQPTLSNIIREIKDGWLAELAKTRQARVAQNRKRLERIVERSFKKDDMANARAAIMDQSKLTGDLAPDVHVMLGGDKSPEELLKQAAEMRALAMEERPDE